MARTNGPNVPPAPHWPSGQQAHGQPAQGHPNQPGSYANPQQPSYAQHGQYAQPAEAYYYPDGSYAADTYSQPTLTHAPAPASHQQWGEPAASSYAPRFEPYTPPTSPPARAQPQPPQYAPPFPEPPPAAHYTREPRIVSHDRGYDRGYAAQPAASAPEWAQPELRGAAYDQQPGWQQAEPQFYPQDAAQGAAGQGYESGYGQGYAPAHDYAAPGDWQQPAVYDTGPQPGYPPAAPQQGFGEAQGYDDPAAYAPPGYPPPQFAPPQYDPQGYPQEAPPGFAPPARSQALEHEYDPVESEFEDEDQGRGGRKMMIAASLVGALGIVGALAYGYTSFFGSGSGAGTPVVKSEGQPAKVKPADPGGKKFAHTDSKILGRLNDGSSAPAADGSDAEGPRKVTTMIVGRDGSIVAAAAGAPAPAQPEPAAAAARPAAAGPVVVSPPPAATPSVPGLTIVDGFGNRGATAPLGAGAGAGTSAAVLNTPGAARATPAVVNTPPAAAPPPTSPPVKAQVIARADPAAAAPPPASPPPASPPKALAADPVKPAAKPAAPKSKDPVAAINTIRQDASRVSGDSAPSGAGYVAVLASMPSSSSSRMDALKQFADLQQRYPAQLQSKAPEVQSAELAGKGTYDRLIAGPPGSRQQATALCAELKAVGYTSCWIKAY